jgi:hypothetical protein
MKHKLIQLISVIVIAAFTWQGQFAYSDRGQFAIENRLPCRQAGKRYKDYIMLRQRAYVERGGATWDVKSRTKDERMRDAAKEGLCVTADTLLTLKDGRQIPIAEIKTGDYVMSLNETTRLVEPHRVIGLLDMGIRPVYKLTTASGKSIKTTANHPYLTREGWVKVSGLKTGDEIAVPRGDTKGNYFLTRKSLSSRTNNLLLNLEGEASRSNLFNAATSFSAEGGCILNRIMPQYLRGGYINMLEKWTSLVINILLPAADSLITSPFFMPEGTRFTSCPSATKYSVTSMPIFSSIRNFILRACRKGGVLFVLNEFRGKVQGCLDMVFSKSGVAFDNLLDGFSGFKELKNQVYHYPRSLETRLPMANVRIGSDIVLNPHIYSPLLKLLYHTSAKMSRLPVSTGIACAEPFDKSSGLDPERSRRTDEMPAGDILWDKIVSIEPLGPRHVYDIEVEGTHNFIGNGIFAHNTAIPQKRAKPNEGMDAPKGKRKLQKRAEIDRAQRTAYFKPVYFHLLGRYFAYLDYLGIGEVTHVVAERGKDFIELKARIVTEEGTEEVPVNRIELDGKTGRPIKMPKGQGAISLMKILFLQGELDGGTYYDFAQRREKLKGAKGNYKYKTVAEVEAELKQREIQKGGKLNNTFSALTKPVALGGDPGLLLACRRLGIDLHVVSRPYDMPEEANAELARRKRRRGGEVNITVRELCRPKSEGGDITLYFRCLEFGIKIPGMRNPYPTPEAARDELKRRAGLPGGEANNYPVALQKPKDQGGDWALYYASRGFGTELPEAPRRVKTKYPTPKSAKDGLKARVERFGVESCNRPSFLRRPVKDGGDQTLLKACGDFRIPLPQEEEVKDPVILYLNRLGQMPDEDEMRKLWEQALQGDTDLRNLFIEKMLPLLPAVIKMDLKMELDISKPYADIIDDLIAHGNYVITERWEEWDGKGSIVDFFRNLLAKELRETKRSYYADLEKSQISLDEAKYVKGLSPEDLLISREISPDQMAALLGERDPFDLAREVETRDLASGLPILVTEDKERLHDALREVFIKYGLFKVFEKFGGEKWAVITIGSLGVLGTAVRRDCDWNATALTDLPEDQIKDALSEIAERLECELQDNPEGPPTVIVGSNAKSIAEKGENALLADFVSVLEQFEVGSPEKGYATIDAVSVNSHERPVGKDQIRTLAHAGPEDVAFQAGTNRRILMESSPGVTEELVAELVERVRSEKSLREIADERLYVETVFFEKQRRHYEALEDRRGALILPEHIGDGSESAAPAAAESPAARKKAADEGRSLPAENVKSKDATPNTPEKLERLLNEGSFAVISAGPNLSERKDLIGIQELLTERYKGMRAELEKTPGVEIYDVMGRDDMPQEERGFLVVKGGAMDEAGFRQAMLNTAKGFKQDSVSFSFRKNNEIAFTDGRSLYGKGYRFVGGSEDFYTAIRLASGETARFVLNIADHAATAAAQAVLDNLDRTEPDEVNVAI